jgi:hypothetical protein
VHYVVFEQTPPPRYSQGHIVGGGSAEGSIQSTHLVEAKDAQQAASLVLGATRRVGQYAVVEAEFISFLPNESVEATDGILRQKMDRSGRELNGGDDAGQSADVA